MSNEKVQKSKNEFAASIARKSESNSSMNSLAAKIVEKTTQSNTNQIKISGKK